MDPLEHDEAVLAAALALIDEAYEAPPQKKKRCRVSRQRHELLTLRRTLVELETQLRAARTRDDSDLNPMDLASIWSHVALGQRKERETVVCENALLKDAVQRELGYAQQGMRLLDDLNSMWKGMNKGLTMRMYPNPGATSSIPTELLDQLNLVCERAVASVLEDTEPFQRTRSTKWSPSQNELRIRHRATSEYPFRMSRVANELWRLLLLRTIGRVTSESLDQDEVWCSSTTFHMSTSFGLYEVHGPMALRRVFTATGGVLLVVVSTATATATPDNLVAGLKTFESGWVRIERLDHQNPTSPVFVESVQDTEMDAAYPLARSTEAVTESITTRLKRVDAFFERCESMDGSSVRQELENRLLDEVNAKPSRPYTPESSNGSRVPKSIVPCSSK